MICVACTATGSDGETLSWASWVCVDVCIPCYHQRPHWYTGSPFTVEAICVCPRSMLAAGRVLGICVISAVTQDCSYVWVDVTGKRHVKFCGSAAAGVYVDVHDLCYHCWPKEPCLLRSESLLTWHCPFLVPGDQVLNLKGSCIRNLALFLIGELVLHHIEKPS